MNSWPKRFRARLHGWNYAREAARMLGLDFVAEQRFADGLSKMHLTLLVDSDGTARIIEVNDRSVCHVEHVGGLAIETAL